MDDKIKEKLLVTYRELKNIPTLSELLDILIEKDFPSTEDEIYAVFNGLSWKKFDNYRSILLKETPKNIL